MNYRTMILAAVIVFSGAVISYVNYVNYESDKYNVEGLLLDSHVKTLN